MSEPFARARPQALFGEASRLNMHGSIEQFLENMIAWGGDHPVWAVAWSGGKDSTACLTLLIWALLGRRLAEDEGDEVPARFAHLLDAMPRPKRLLVMYADTRMELLPLWLAAKEIREHLTEYIAPMLADIGIELVVHEVMAPIDRRFFPYMLGRGVPPPNNNTFRWCTGALKVLPMQDAIEQLAIEAVEVHDAQLAEQAQALYNGRRDRGDLKWAKLLKAAGYPPAMVITGVRVGESAARDQRLAVACSKDGAECGQGHYQSALNDKTCATFAPLVHFRVCHVWEWLKGWAPRPVFGDWDTEALADAYGGDEAEETHARTGCVGCPLATKDSALDGVLKQPRWAYLRPLKRLRPIYRELRTPQRRLRKARPEELKDGTLSKNGQRQGPLTIEARRWALGEILAVQDAVNAEARRLRRPTIDLINADELRLIRELLDAGTWPDKWTGEEPRADMPLDRIVVINDPAAEGGQRVVVQPLLFAPDALFGG